jgi:hypothetical protein
MKDAVIELPFPFGGLSASGALDAIQTGMTHDAINVRGYSTYTGRNRGGQRPGLSKYMPSAYSSGLQDLNHLVVSLKRRGASGVAAVYLKSTATIPYDLVNTTTGTAAGVGPSGTAPALHCACCDNLNNFYVAYAESGASTLTIRKINAAGAVAATATLTGIAGVVAQGIATDGTHLYVQVSSTAGGFGLPVYKFLCSTMAQVGASHWYLPADTTAMPTLSNQSLAVAGGVLCVGFGDGGVIFVNTATAALITTAAIVGYAVVDIDTDGFTFFYVLASFGGPSILYKFNLSGATITSAAVGADAASVCFDPKNEVLAISYASPGPGYSVSTHNLLTLALVTSATPGSLQWTTIRPTLAGGYVVWLSGAANNMAGLNTNLTVLWGPSTLSRAVATPPGKAVMATNGVAHATQESIAPVSLTRLACAGGSVYRYTPDGTVNLSNMVGVALSKVATVIFSTPIGSRMYYSDGASYAYYDADLDRTVAPTASSGSYPVDAYGNTGRLLETWRNRLVVSGLLMDPFNWFMSAVGAPDDWNYSPSTTVETQAVAGTNATAGKPPDTVNALVPYSNEILLLGGDHTIHQMTGDPMAGGRIDLVTDAVGMAWGRAWCRDGSGVLYFMSTQASIYRWAPGAVPERISDKITDLLTHRVDLSTCMVRMAWDERAAGAYVFISCPGQSAIHYFWDARNGAWWQDVFANANHNPVAVHTQQGFTRADRVVLVGGNDGYIRYLNPDAADDDGTAISSYVYLGPIKVKERAGQMIVDLQGSLILGSGNAVYGVQAGNSAEDAVNTAAMFTGTFVAGRNRSQAIRSSGQAHFIKLASTQTVGSRWELEYLAARIIVDEGKAGQRVF